MGWVRPFPPRQQGPRSPSQPFTSALCATLSLVGHPYLASEISWCSFLWNIRSALFLELVSAGYFGCLFFFPSKQNAFWIPSYLLKWKVLSVRTVWIPIYVACCRFIDVKNLVASYGVILSLSPLKWGWGGVLVPCSTENEWLDRTGTGVLPNRTPSPFRDHLYHTPQGCELLSSLCVDVQTFHIEVERGRGPACEDIPLGHRTVGKRGAGIYTVVSPGLLLGKKFPNH